MKVSSDVPEAEIVTVLTLNIFRARRKMNDCRKLCDLVLKVILAYV